MIRYVPFTHGCHRLLASLLLLVISLHDLSAAADPVSAQLTQKDALLQRVHEARTNEQKQALLKDFLQQESKVPLPTGTAISPNLLPSTRMPYAELFQEWFREDSEAALREIGLVQDEGVELLGLMSGVRVHSTDQKWLMARIDDLKNSPLRQSRLAFCMAVEVASSQPQVTAQILSRTQPHFKDVELTTSSLSWVIERSNLHFKEVAGLLPMIDFSHSRDLLWRVGTDEDVFVTGCWFMTVEGRSYLGMDHSDVTNRAYRVATDALIERLGVTAFLQEADLSLIPGYRRQGFLYQCLVALTVDLPLEDALQQISHSKIAETKDYEVPLTEALAWGWNYHDVSAYVLSLTDSNSAKKEAACALAKRLAAVSTKRAARWIDSLPAGDLRESVRAAVSAAREERKPIPTD
jgi:hypothetical protein